MSRYCLPLIISGIYVCLSELGFFYLILPVMLVANLLNAYWGEFAMSEVKTELRKFYGTKQAALIKQSSAIGFILMIIWSVHFVDVCNPSYLYLTLFALCTGCLTGCFIVTLAHDMLHSKSKFDRGLSSGLLIAASIPHLAGDHIFGHHHNIGLQDDTTTAKLNQNFYTYFIKLSLTQIKRSFFIAKNIPGFMRKKILMSSLLRTGLWLLACIVIILITDNWYKCLLFFLMQGFIAYTLYELINYIQHYGLTRKAGSEPITLTLSWNCYYKYTNYILFMLPIHSLHHLPAKNKKIKEEDLLNGPKMPYLYFVMIGMALIPPVWFKKMNALALKYNYLNGV